MFQDGSKPESWRRHRRQWWGLSEPAGRWLYGSFPYGPTVFSSACQMTQGALERSDQLRSSKVSFRILRVPQHPTHHQLENSLGTPQSYRAEPGWAAYRFTRLFSPRVAKPYITLPCHAHVVKPPCRSKPLSRRQSHSENVPPERA